MVVDFAQKNKKKITRRIAFFLSTRNKSSFAEWFASDNL
jgi:hypothetical protein